MDLNLIPLTCNGKIDITSHIFENLYEGKIFIENKKYKCFIISHKEIKGIFEGDYTISLTGEIPVVKIN